MERIALQGKSQALQTSRPAESGYRSGQFGERTRSWYAERYTQEGRVEMSEKRYPIVIERTVTGFSAYSPDVPGLSLIHI